ncbi:MAG: hypothetical protein LRY76_07190 [Alphaproteobacteria bacterium]|nr:hypothetical protein [Alphaproteobacteria bacterium]
MTDLFKKVSVDKAIKFVSDAFNGALVAGVVAFGLHVADSKPAAPAEPAQIVEPVQQ